jgi:predicted nucleic acid-binding protein
LTLRPTRARVYLETTVVSYLTSRSSRDIVVAGHQQVTREWWDSHGDRFEVVASQLVFQEASIGDPEAARRRLEALSQVELVPITPEAVSLAQGLIQNGVLPSSANSDALHLAAAVTNGVDYLITWNCRHLANAALRKRIEEICRANGYDPVIICTPDELVLKPEE